ncbi:MAG TPA: glycosyltransferase family 39 protein [Gemmatales bacterium]|nr:glycosyltransferase family 39 protein [Gemmatales bacterium]
MSISWEIAEEPVAEVVRLQSTEKVRKSPLSELLRLQLPMLIVWSLLLFLYGIHQGDLYRTEGLRAIIGKEMYRTSDWIVPRLYGEPILTKPPMFYWAIAATGVVFGEVTTWLARLPAALAGMITVLIVYFTVRRCRDSLTALLCAMALPMSVLWLEKASNSEIDTLLVMWVLGAWACFLRVMETKPTDCVRGLGWWIAALICVAGGVLTKWMGFLFFYVMVIPLLAWHRQLRRLFHWHHLLAALIGVVLVWCWLGAVVYELGWSNVVNMLWKEGAPRVIHGQSASQHLWVETLVHPVKVLGLALPWSAIALFGWWRGRQTTEAYPLKEPTCLSRSYLDHSLWCWAIFGTMMMTVFPDHNIRQSFSLVPAWTLLGALALVRTICEPYRGMVSRSTGKPWYPSRWLIGIVLIWCLVKVIYVEVIIPARFAKRPSLASQAKIMHEFVPAEATLYLCKVKDECLMFNYGRTVRRVASWDQLPTHGSCWCVLTEAERATFSLPIKQEQRLLDAQGEPLLLCRVRVRTLE